MAREHAVLIEESLRIPADALTFEGFRRWVHTPEFPETGRIDYLAGDIEIDMSPEDLHAHGIVKVAITVALNAVVTEREIGEIFVDRTRVSSRLATLSVEPDVVVVLWESLQTGRVRYIPAASQEPDRYVEIEGAPDVVVEVVSDSSVKKDTKRLPALYARAGIPSSGLPTPGIGTSASRSVSSKRTGTSSWSRTSRGGRGRSGWGCSSG